MLWGSQDQTSWAGSWQWEMAADISSKQEIVSVFVKLEIHQLRMGKAAGEETQAVREQYSRHVCRLSWKVSWDIKLGLGVVTGGDYQSWWRDLWQVFWKSGAMPSVVSKIGKDLGYLWKGCLWEVGTALGGLRNQTWERWRVFWEVWIAVGELGSTGEISGSGIAW